MKADVEDSAPFRRFYLDPESFQLSEGHTVPTNAANVEC